MTAATIGYLHRRRHRPGNTPHIAGMGLSYIAMLTALYVDNGPHLPLLDRLPSLTFWLPPSVVGIPVTIRALRRNATHTPAPTARDHDVNGHAKIIRHERA